jgi:carbamoyl-phosphate synthase large subunit
MKSIGEVMAIGRKLEEAMQKAIRMLNIERELTDVEDLSDNQDEIKNILENPTDQRVFYIVKAIKCGVAIEEIYKLSGIDPWFLYKIKNIVDFEYKIRNGNEKTIRTAKELGFSDKKIGMLIGKSENEVRKFRKDAGIVPFVKQIDRLTTAVGMT